MAACSIYTMYYGRELANHRRIAGALEARVYFARPYAPWERELNENTNGLIRQYFPKGRDLSAVSEAETQYVMNQLNHQPRKIMGFQTPYEVFFKTRTPLTVALAG